MQVWFADDASGVGVLKGLRQWWNAITSIGPSFGYHPSAAKTCLMIREEQREATEQIFEDTGIVSTTEGKNHLGAAIGSPTFIEDFIAYKVEEWTAEVETLAKVAGSQPQAAYAAFTHGMQHRWKYLSRTVPNCGHLLQPLEQVIERKFIPSVTGRPPCSQAERTLLALPARLGGMGLEDPTVSAQPQFEASREITAPLVQSILEQRASFEDDPTTHHHQGVSMAKRTKEEQLKTDFETIRRDL